MNARTMQEYQCDLCERIKCVEGEGLDPPEGWQVFRRTHKVAHICDLCKKSWRKLTTDPFREEENPPIETLPTEPQQPDIGQRFYAKDGTLLEVMEDGEDNQLYCKGCYYTTLWNNNQCPKPIPCQTAFRDDKTSVCFLPVDTARQAEAGNTDK